ncbi:hypothetical protein PIROE2DRAFT_4504, partial [Piromyces sp. E2]
GLRSKGNSYAHDDFCVSDNEYEDDISNSEHNTQNTEEGEAELESEDQYFNDKKLEYSLDSSQDRVLYSQDSIIQKRNNKKKKNVILESSYDSDDIDSSIENEDKENEDKNKDNNTNFYYGNKSNNDINYNSNDIFNDSEIFSSSPILPSIDMCMDKLFSNHNTPQKNENDPRKRKNDSNNDNFTIDEELLGNKKEIYKNENNKESIALPKSFDNKINDPLNLFTDDIEESTSNQLFKTPKKKLNYTKKPKNKICVPFTANDEFTIDENLLGIKEMTKPSNKYNVDNNLLSGTSLDKIKSINNINLDTPIVTIDEISKPLSNLFSNDIDDSTNKVKGSSSKLSKNKGKSNLIVDDDEDNIDDKESYSNNNNNDNDNDHNDHNKDYNLKSDTNDEINDLINLLSNDIKDSSIIDSDEEFIMASNTKNSDKVNVKSLYSSDALKSNEDEIVLDSSIMTNNDDGIYENEINIENETNKTEAENKLIQLFDDDVIDNEMNNESDDDFFDEQKKKYYKQTFIKELIDSKKSKNGKDSTNLITSKRKENNKLFKDTDTKEDNSLNINIFNTSKKTLSLSHSHPKKTKLEFYFKELPSSSTSSSTTNSSKTPTIEKTHNNNSIEKGSPLFYNVSKNRKRLNEDDCVIKNPFVISKKQKLKDKMLADRHNEHNQFNRVLLDFESNDKPKAPQTSLFNQLSSNKKQKKQVSILSLFSSQSVNKDNKMVSPVKADEYNAIITNITKPNKVSHQDFHKAKSTNSKVRIRNRQDKLSMEKVKYIKPSLYVLTCEKKNVSKNRNPNINKRGMNHPKPISIFDCQEIKHPFHSSGNKANNGKIGNINDNYDLMKERLIKKHEHSLVNSFITSFEEQKSDFIIKNKSSTIWPPINWNGYFQNSIANSF